MVRSLPWAAETLANTARKRSSGFTSVTEVNPPLARSLARLLLHPAESTEPAREAERPAPGVVGRAQGLGIYQVIIAGAVAS